jgi:hypothetical protein
MGLGGLITVAIAIMIRILGHVNNIHLIVASSFPIQIKKEDEDE